MSKELTPLKALKELKKRYGKNFSLQDDERMHIIETTLKNYEELTSKPVILCGRTHGHTKALIDTICKNYKEVKITNLEDENKVKALEIIKEKVSDIKWLKYCNSLEQYNACVSSYEQLTQEQFDLLKEVM